ncbi:MAG: hypothetical protein ACRYG7_42770 [Janthinobacterium lividum]
MPDAFDNRRIIWESRAKQVGVIGVSYLFVAITIWTRAQYSAFRFWGTILFFGSGGIGVLYRLLNPKNLFVTPTSALGKQIIAEQFEKAQADIGAFYYNEEGFLLVQELGEITYRWVEIETMFGYKRDDYVTDEICLDLFFCNNMRLALTESTAGWYQFLLKLQENLLEIPSDWQMLMAAPAFETKLTLLFDKCHRTQEQAEALYYKD